ncbi:HET-domain-containing protein [Apiospora phragmitis]|uniref:HET-domain-containing protein n=1 Tax=Apiospora phragmitis TaxID=2905665 RepID=A0ABR1VG85_9PEZI
MELEYIPLRHAEVDVRLASVLPGHDSGPIRLILWHVPLTGPPSMVTSSDASRQRTLFEVQTSLPKDWVAAVTLEGRLLFEHEPSEQTSWAHPDPSSYQQPLHEPLELPLPGFEPRYEALSYLWGSPADPRPVQVAQLAPGCLPVDRTDHSMLQWTTVKVGQNLEAALQHLRLHDQPRNLWIDALCINQQDEDEKSKQIVRMATLYRMASRVVVWLGPESPSEQSTVAMPTLEHLGKQLELSQSTVRFASPTATEPAWFRAVTPLPYSEETWLAIQALLSRPYFGRLWIMQEILLANSKTLVMCGRDEVAWYHLIRAIVCLVAKDSLPSHLRRPLECVRALTWRFDQLSIPFIMNLGRQRQCYMVKDRIYGVLGITPPEFTRSIKPDYKVEDRQVFMDAALACMNYDNRLTLLQDCEFPSTSSQSTENSQRPSWVPDWSVPRVSRPLSDFVLFSGISRSCSRFISPDMLQVTGRRLAVLDEVGPPTPADPWATLCHIQGMEPRGLTTESYIAGGSLLDAFLQVLRLGYLDDRWPGHHLPTLAAWKQYFLDRLHSANGVPSGSEVDNSDGYFATSIPKGRSFIKTEEGHIGLAPAGARQGVQSIIAVLTSYMGARLLTVRKGDVACTLLGCKSSILLRQADAGGRFRVVGESYIHGLDDTSGILGQLPEGWSVQIEKDASGHARYSYHDSKTDSITKWDPRLGPLPQNWVPSNHSRRAGTPSQWDCFENTETGEVMDSDPRLLPRALEISGVMLEEFLLY